jgi:hypothetical protein
VFCLLAAYCLLILGAGFWLARKGKLAHLGFLGPAAGVVTASVFAILGARARHTVPPTVAFFQRVDTETGSDQVDVRGLMAVYHPDPFDDLPEVTRGGLFSPDMTGLLGEIRRMVWTDLDAWRWEGLRLPAGAHYAPFRQTLKLEAPMAATGAFGPDGFSGTLSGTLQGISDALLTAPSGENLAVRFDTSGHFAAGSADALAPAQYIAAGLLSDQQRHRQSVYGQLLPAGSPQSDRHFLFLWADPLDVGFRVSEDVRQVGSALVRLPVDIAPASPGARVLVPSPFLTYQKTQVGSAPSASAFINSRREWVRLNHTAETWLRFQLPAQVLPLAVAGATLTVDLDVPLRPVEILGWVAGSPVRVFQTQGPRGKLGITIGRADILRPDARGGIVLGLRVGDERTLGSTPKSLVHEAGTGWKIESVALEVTGNVLPRQQ